MEASFVSLTRVIRLSHLPDVDLVTRNISGDESCCSDTDYAITFVPYAYLSLVPHSFLRTSK